LIKAKSLKLIGNNFPPQYYLLKLLSTKVKVCALFIDLIDLLIEIIFYICIPNRFDQLDVGNAQ